ncbi:MAG: cobalamin-dependent protein, partial [Burkholderiales bacterium]|nr:cobalamin-dependent protein [Burkholderiales bacterium]
PGVVLRDPAVVRCEAAPALDRNATLDQVLAWLQDGQPALCEAWLSAELARLGPAAFADDLLGPLLVAVGEGWSAQRVRVFEEHGLSALVLRVLAAAPAQHPHVGVVGTAQATPTVLLTTLSGEQHSLGLAMVDAVLRSAGAHPVRLGACLPLEEVVAAAQCFRASVVALSLSPALSGRLALQQINRLRRLLPDHVGLWVGGGGVATLARVPRGVSAFTSCRPIEAALATLAIHTPHVPLAQRVSSLFEPGVAMPGGMLDALHTLD